MDGVWRTGTACIAVLALILVLPADDALAGPITGGTNLVVADDPAAHVEWPPSATPHGVPYVFITYADSSWAYCSGSLLLGGRHVLTAAHCLVNASGSPATSVVTATWVTGSFQHVVAASTWTAHPDYIGANFFDPYDLAVLTLEQEYDPRLTRYDIYTEGDEVGRVGEKLGYGGSGVGSTQFYDTRLRSGLNRYDAEWDTVAALIGIPTLNDSILLYDFDDGLPEHDAFGAHFGLPDTGLGDEEVHTAPGDSGGPMLIDGKVAGVHSFGFTLDGPYFGLPDTDALPGYNNSFGEYGADTRVSYFTDWIREQNPLVGTAAEPIPEPGTWALSTLGALALLGWRRRRRALAGPG